MNQFDIAVFQWFNSWVGIDPRLDLTIKFAAVSLLYAVIAGTLLRIELAPLDKLWNNFRKYLEFIIFVGISSLFSRFVITEFIRFFYDRPRPFEVFEDVRQLVDHTSGGSFPSGHAALAFAVATTVSFYYPKTSALFFLAALSIGGGRIAAGVHWPSDILGGAFVGIVTAIILRKLWLYRK